MATAKVIGQIKTTLAKSLAYISRPDATSDGLWVSTNAAVIDPSDAIAVARQMRATSERVGVTRQREGSVLAHHLMQSFDPSEETNVELAHRLGVQLAERFTNGQHEYMVATHLDRGHVHNHIIFNAVNMETGRKFRMLRDSQPELRAMSDELCKVAGLRVLATPENVSGRSTQRSLGEINASLRAASWKDEVRTAIDKAIHTSVSWEQVQAQLFKAGVETHARGGRNSTLSFRHVQRDRKIRDWRLGAAYTEESIMARLAKQRVNMVSVDASMIVKESRDKLTITVPGTRRELEITVAKKQIVRSGRALRVYLPYESKHALANRNGQYARTVTTAGLYDYFAKPDIAQVVKGSKDKELTGRFFRWDDQLKELRALGERVNAKSRYMRTGDDAATALDKARATLTDRHDRYQTTLVALAEKQAEPSPNLTEIRALTAELNSIERALGTVKSDVRALTQLTRQEAKMEVSDRIAHARTQVVQEQREQDETARRERQEDHDRDRETPAHREELEAEQTDIAAEYEDQAHDRDAANEPDEAPKTLAERIAEQQEAIRADRAARNSGQKPDGRTH